jgi:hypothetical protein
MYSRLLPHRILGSVMPSFKCLYYFTSSEFSVVEIKRTDLVEGAPLSDIYRWLIVIPQKEEVFDLEFKSMQKIENEEFRSFVEGEFRFNRVEGYFNLLGKNFQLVFKNQNEVSDAILDLIAKHLVNPVSQDRLASFRTLKNFE